MISHDAFRRLSTVVAITGLASSAGLAGAQTDYPARPLRFLVGAAPGGATEILARAIGTRLGEKFRQQVVIDTRPGANHIIAGEINLQAAPDGYTIQMIPEGWVINASVYSKLPFDPVRDFTPIGTVAMVPNVLVIHPSISAKTVPEFIALAQRRPGEMSYGTSGVGSPSHMSAEFFKILAKVEYTHVPYKGSGLSLIDLMGGHLQLSFPSVPASFPHVKAGRLRALGVTTVKRASALPDVPTIQESGVAGFEVSGWYGVIAPRGVVKPLVERLNREINAVLQMPELSSFLAGQGADPLTGTPEAFAAAMANDRVKWAKVVKSAGIKMR
ncbi:MAG: tripartite tricarboxylate transporter substrate binding protein [Betaproteobacteria bacterium]|nr:tripartite tricarboxylate transporter substrate binding protein [Betaproteobacteria bacterium]